MTPFQITLLSVLLSPAPQDSSGGDWFELHRENGNKRLLVSANKYGVTAESAIRRLATRLNWRVSTESNLVEQKLGQVTLDLAFTKQPPRIVAHLISASAGLDIAFDDSALSQNGGRVQLHVISTPTGESESGRARLRKWAIHWYSQFLTEDPTVSHSPIVQEKGLEAMMHLGRLLLQAKDLEEAVKVYDRIIMANDSHMHVPLALLRMTEAQYEMATLPDLPEAKRDKHLRLAEKSARRLMKMHETLRPTAQATVLLGRILMQGERYSECIKMLEASSLRMSNTPEIIDIYLLIAECYTHGELPERVIHSLDTLQASRAGKDWTKRQWRDYHYLRGLGAEYLGHNVNDGEEKVMRFAEAMQSLEWFLGMGRDDVRRGQAFVILGRVYLELGKFLEARAATVEALLEKSNLDVNWLQAARILEAKTALALGERETALEKLEVVVRPNPEKMPKLVLFLIDQLIEIDRYDRAISNANLLVKVKNRSGDEARFRKIVALYKQASVSGTMNGFPSQAIEIAKNLDDTVSSDLQRKAAEIIGKAYESLNMIEQAADAYRGILK